MRGIAIAAVIFLAGCAAHHKPIDAEPCCILVPIQPQCYRDFPDSSGLRVRVPCAEDKVTI